MVICVISITKGKPELVSLKHVHKNQTPSTSTRHNFAIPKKKNKAQKGFRTIIGEELHAGLQEFHGRSVEGLLAAGQAGQDTRRLQGPHQNREASQVAREAMLHVALGAWGGKTYALSYYVIKKWGRGKSRERCEWEYFPDKSTRTSLSTTHSHSHPFRQYICSLQYLNQQPNNPQFEYTKSQAVYHHEKRMTTKKIMLTLPTCAHAHSCVDAACWVKGPVINHLKHVTSC